MKIRLYTYKSKRYYGGRDITVTPHILEAELVKKQEDGTLLFKLLEPCPAAYFHAGHLIAILPKDVLQKEI